MKEVLDSLPLPAVYYHPHSKSYYREDAKGKWIPVNEVSAKRFLGAKGYDNRAEKGKNISAVDECVLNIQTNQNVDYVAPLAGYASGPHQINGHAVLVTESPKLIVPKEGEWPMLKSIFEGMFNDVHADQCIYFYAWLKISMEMYRRGQWLPGHALILAGPIRSAKSLAQSLITVMFGGRSAKPYLFLTGRTDFNADLFRCEHLMVEDDAESIDIRSRRHFGAGIKSVAVNRDQHCHGKNKDGLTLSPHWRLTISVNDDPERLQVIPPLDTDVADKIMLLKVNRREMPMPTGSPEEQEQFWKTLVKEIPAFLHYLETLEIPQQLRSPRFGVVHFHHPELVSALQQTAPEQRLLSLIDLEVFGDPTSRLDTAIDRWEGTSAKLELLLKKDGSRVQQEARRLLDYHNTCGTYLARLESQPGSRVTKCKSNGNHIWTIRPPTNPAPNGGAGEHVCELIDRECAYGGIGRTDAEWCGKHSTNLLPRPPVFDSPVDPKAPPALAPSVVVLTGDRKL